MSSSNHGDAINVSVRLRPVNAREMREVGAEINWKYNKTQLMDSHKVKGTKVHSFDNVFPPEMDNAAVYDKLAANVVRKVLDGFNGTVFAYGQTGSGKTYSMLGEPENPGVIPRAIEEVFDHVERSEAKAASGEEGGASYLLRVSYLEIYNERINDLLQFNKKNAQAGQNLKILKDDPTRGAIISGLREVIVASADEAMDLIREGEANRHYGSTNMNLKSSRSHTVFRLVLESSKTEDDDASGDDADENAWKTVGGSSEQEKHVKISYLNLVDLAGSERQSDTEASGKRLKEGSAINKSLLVLGEVISKLSGAEAKSSDRSSHSPPQRHKGRRAGAKKAQVHIPYRSSKLTRILKQSLGGNTNTSLLCTITPSPLHKEESVSTLKFGTMCKTIKNRAKQNQIKGDKALIKQYKKQIEEMQKTMEEKIANERKRVESQEALVEEMVLQRLNDLRSRSFVGPGGIMRRKSSFEGQNEEDIAARLIQRLWRRFELKRLRELRVKLKEEKRMQKSMENELKLLQASSKKKLMFQMKEGDLGRSRSGSGSRWGKGGMKKKRMSMFVTSDGGPRALLREGSVSSALGTRKTSPHHRRGFSSGSPLARMRSFRTSDLGDISESQDQSSMMNVSMEKVREILKKKKQESDKTIAGKDDEIKALEDRVVFFEGRFTSMVNDARERDTYEQKMRDAFSALEAQNEELRSQIEALDVKCRKAIASEAATRQSLEDERGVRTKAESQLSSMQHTVKKKFGRRLSVVLRDVQRDVAAIDKEKVNLEEHAKSVEAREEELERGEASLNTMRMLAERNLERVKSTEARLIEDEARVDAKVRDVVQREERMRRAQAELAQEKRSLKTEVHRVEQFEMELHRLRDRIQEDKAKLIEDSEAFKKNVDAERERERLAHAARRIQAFRRRNRMRLLRHREAAVEILEKRREDLKRRDKMLKARVKELEEENARSSKLKAEVEASRAQAVGAQAALGARERAFAHRNGRIRELEKDNELLSEALRERKDKLAVQESVIQMREQELKEKERELKEEKRVVEKLNRESERAKRRQDEMEKAHMEKHRELVFRERQIEKVMEEVERGEQLLEGRAMALRQREHKAEELRSKTLVSRQISGASSISVLSSESASGEPAADQSVERIEEEVENAKANVAAYKSIALASKNRVDELRGSMDTLCTAFADALGLIDLEKLSMSEGVKAKLQDCFMKARHIVLSAEASGNVDGIEHARMWKMRGVHRCIPKTVNVSLSLD